MKCKSLAKPSQVLTLRGKLLLKRERTWELRDWSTDMTNFEEFHIVWHFQEIFGLFFCVNKFLISFSVSWNSSTLLVLLLIPTHALHGTKTTKTAKEITKSLPWRISVKNCCHQLRIRSVTNLIDDESRNEINTQSKSKLWAKGRSISCGLIWEGN